MDVRGEVCPYPDVEGRRGDEEAEGHRDRWSSSPITRPAWRRSRPRPAAMATHGGRADRLTGMDDHADAEGGDAMTDSDAAGRPGLLRGGAAPRPGRAPRRGARRPVPALTAGGARLIVLSNSSPHVSVIDPASNRSSQTTDLPGLHLAGPGTTTITTPMARSSGSACAIRIRTRSRSSRSISTRCSLSTRSRWHDDDDPLYRQGGQNGPSTSARWAVARLWRSIRRRSRCPRPGTCRSATGRLRRRRLHRRRRVERFDYPTCAGRHRGHRES